ncbi:MAG: DUF4861 family protein [bacterium]|nr:DUF4861 family protein [bacterium]
MFLGAILAAALVNAQYVPERMDDFCWENEFCGMRAYGPGVSQPPPKGEGLFSSGFDVFNKAIPDVQMAETLIRGVKEKISYHKNNGRGFDNYKVSTGRGCGGIGSLGVSGWKHETNWKAQRLIEKTETKAVFELDYEAYTLRGTVTAGCAFTKFEVIPRKGSNEPILRGPGLDVSAKRQHDGLLKIDLARGFIANFEPETEGHVLTAIVLDPSCGKGALASDDMDCAYLLQKNEAFTYYAGAAWSGAGKFKTAEDWFAYVRAFADGLKK